MRDFDCARRRRDYVRPREVAHQHAETRDEARAHTRHRDDDAAVAHKRYGAPADARDERDEEYGTDGHVRRRCHLCVFFFARIKKNKNKKRKVALEETQMQTRIRFGSSEKLRDATSMFEELRCPISKTLMLDPVLISSGYTFDRDSIEGWARERGLKCPISGLGITNVVVPNLTVRSLTLRFARTYSDVGGEIRDACLLLRHTYNQPGFRLSISRTLLRVSEMRE